MPLNNTLACKMYQIILKNVCYLKRSAVVRFLFCMTPPHPFYGVLALKQNRKRTRTVVTQHAFIRIIDNFRCARSYENSADFS